MSSDTNQTNDNDRESSILPQRLELANDSSEICDIILSAVWRNGKLGASYYICDESELYVLNDIVDVNPEFKNLRSLVHQVNPSKVLTCGGLSEKFITTLKTLLGDETGEASTSDDTIINTPKKLHINGRKKDFSYESCKRSILGIRFAFQPDTSCESERLLFIQSMLDLRAESMVRSLGILFKFLEKYLPQTHLTNSVVPIMAVHHISLKDLVSIDEDTSRALQIFSHRLHPSAFKKWTPGSSKEGLSIFGIFNRCKSIVGAKKMRQIFTYPTRNLQELNARLDAVEFFCKPQHEHILSNMLDCIKKIQSITGILTRMYRTQAETIHWKSLYNTLYNTIMIGQMCQLYAKHSKLFETIALSVTDELQEVAHYINRVIDFQESSDKNKFVVREGINAKLDSLRQSAAQVPDVMLRVSKLELDDLPPFITQCSVAYIAELGYLLSVPIWKDDPADTSLYQLPGFEVKFIADKFVYYKTPRCQGLDHVLGDFIAKISSVENRIMILLTQFVHRHMIDILKAVNLVAELDCVISLAIVAKEYNYQRPHFTTERRIEIINGRHPLQELCVDNFVPNDTHLSFENGLVHILTGPNASGKSIYLKQVTLISFLAHIGSFVPATSATIGILDNIHSRVQSLESVSYQMSSFFFDLKQMSLSLYNSTPTSLIILDEFGTGTTEIDGLSLLTSCLLSLINRGENCPFVIVSTHFLRLPKLLPESSLVKLQMLEHVIEKDEVVYLYQVKDGISMSSLAHLAAKTVGLDENSMKRSQEILSGIRDCTPNKNLSVTKYCLQEIKFMQKYFQILEETSNEEDNSVG